MVTRHKIDAYDPNCLMIPSDMLVNSQEEGCELPVPINPFPKKLPNGYYPLVMTNKKLLKMAIEIVDLPIKNGDVQ